MAAVAAWQPAQHSYVDSQPDFVRLAEAYGAVGIRCSKPSELDDAIEEMIRIDRPVLFDCHVVSLANCFPMIPSGKAHNEMLLGADVSDEEIETAIGTAGKVLV